MSNDSGIAMDCSSRTSRSRDFGVRWTSARKTRWIEDNYEQYSTTACASDRNGVLHIAHVFFIVTAINITTKLEREREREREREHGISRKLEVIRPERTTSCQFSSHARFQISLFLTSFFFLFLSIASLVERSSSHMYVNECTFNFIRDAVFTAEIHRIKNSLFRYWKVIERRRDCEEINRIIRSN